MPMLDAFMQFPAFSTIKAELYSHYSFAGGYVHRICCVFHRIDTLNSPLLCKTCSEVNTRWQHRRQLLLVRLEDVDRLLVDFCSSGKSLLSCVNSSPIIGPHNYHCMTFSSTVNYFFLTYYVLSRSLIDLSPAFASSLILNPLQLHVYLDLFIPLFKLLYCFMCLSCYSNTIAYITLKTLSPWTWNDVAFLPPPFSVARLDIRINTLIRESTAAHAQSFSISDNTHGWEKTTSLRHPQQPMHWWVYPRSGCTRRHAVCLEFESFLWPYQLSWNCTWLWQKVWLYPV